MSGKIFFLFNISENEKSIWKELNSENAPKSINYRILEQLFSKAIQTELKASLSLPPTISENSISLPNGFSNKDQTVK